MALTLHFGGGFGIVVARLGAQLVILDAQVHYHFSKTEEQLAVIDQIAARYSPQVVIIETDAQQKGLANDDRLAVIAARRTFTIQPHLTRMQKLDVIFGVASMDQSFKAGLIRIPYGDDQARHKMEPFLKQLREWRPDVPTKRLKQDMVMALWFVHKYWQQRVQAALAETATLQSRPSWVRPDPRFRKKGAA